MSDTVTFEVTHRTTYAYRADVTTGYSLARLTPRATPTQTCTAADVRIEPAPSDRRDRVDHFGNRTTWFAVQEPHRRLEVTATSTIVVRQAPPSPEQLDTPGPDEIRQRLSTGRSAAALEARGFVLESPMLPLTPTVRRYAADAFPPSRSVLDSSIELMHRIHHDIRYTPGATTIHTTPDEVLGQGRGVCQDLAHLLVACVRAQGLAARYVSGYLETQPPPGQERLVGVDASHAWASVFVPDHGWVDLDPTNDVCPTGRHLTLAWGRDFSDVTPLKGVVVSTGAGHDLAVAVDVVRV